MINFFRKTREKMADDNRPLKYLRYAVGEIVLVVIGILIALSINNWNQKQLNHNKGQDYIFSLIEDAKTDLSNLKMAIALNEKRIVNLDSLAYICFNYNLKDKYNPEFMVWYMKSLAHPNFVTQTDRTLSQLKNSGGMALIKDKNKIDAIINYVESFDRLYNQQEWYEGGLKDLVDAGISVFNYKYLPKPNEKFDSKISFTGAQLLGTDKKLILELGNRASILSLLTSAYLKFLKEGQQECIELIDILENNN